MNYEDKSNEYYSNVRLDILNLLPSKKKSLNVLEIGAGYGETLFYLKQNGFANEAVGIELFEDKDNPKNYKNIDKFIFGDINTLNLEEFKHYFDLILLPDVLEHIYNPEVTLKKVKNLLKQNGEVLVSMPNIRHYSVFKKIFLLGDFKYEESGIFDYTHVRFYCKKNIQELLESSGFKILQTESSIRNFKGRSTSKVINSITFGLLEEFFTTQYFFRISSNK